MSAFEEFAQLKSVMEECAIRNLPASLRSDGTGLFMDLSAKLEQDFESLWEV
jgi:hypothetical protein